MITHSEKFGTVMSAIGAVQRTLGGVPKDSVNPHFHNRYASLEQVIDTIKNPLADSGCVFTQAPGRVVADPELKFATLEVTTLLYHVSGEWMQSVFQVPLAKIDPQAAGAAITYGCRYALMATLGLPPIDDDAESAYGHSNGGTKVVVKEESKSSPKREPVEERVVDLLIGTMKASANKPDAARWRSENDALIQSLSDRQYAKVVDEWKTFISTLTEGKAA